MSLDAQRLSQLSEAKQALLRQRLKGDIGFEPKPRIARRQSEDPAPLTQSQRGIWTAHNLYPDRSVWNLTDAFRIQGDFNPDRLEQALSLCIARHDVFRMGVPRDLPPRMEIHPEIAPPLERIDLSYLPAEAARAEAEDLAAREMSSAFDITRPSLLKAMLIRMACDEHLLVFKLHHLAGDGWSFGVIVRDVQEIYTALAEGREPSLPDLPIQFADYAVAELEVDPADIASVAGPLQDAPRLSTLPPDFSRPSVFDVDGGCHRFTIPPETVEAVGRLGRQYATTKFAVMFTAFMATLSRFANQPDIVVGTPTANRRHPEVENLVGMFVNTVVQRARFDQGVSFGQALTQVAGDLRTALQRQHVPFEAVLERLAMARDVSFHPLFQVMFVYQNWPFPPLRFPGVRMTRANAHPGSSKYDLTVVIEERDGALEGYAEFSTALYAPQTIATFTQGFCQLLSEATRAPDCLIEAMLPASPQQRQAILAHWDGGSAGVFRPVRQQIEAQAAAQPDKVAIRHADEHLTYGALERRANAVARAMARAGWAPGTRAGLLVSRGVDMAVAILACLKAGVCYVPLDQRHPSDRLRAILADAKAPRLLTDPTVAALAATLELDILAIGQETLDAYEFVARPDPADLAYVIYTSGSTGVPKGVVVTQANFSAAVLSSQSRPGVLASDTVLALSTLAFDAHVMDLIAPLAAGATVHVANQRDAADPLALARVIEDEGLTLIQATPSTWRLLKNAGWQGSKSVKALVGAEVLDPELAAWMVSRLGEVWHLYGVTECAVWQAGGRLSAADAQQGRIPLAAPLPGHRLLVLDRNLALLPPGLIGELYIGGEGVAPGYLDNPALSAERFLPDPFASDPAHTLYKTGDLARLRQDGRLELIGRGDFQVKVRGSRVELGEVETRLRALNAIDDAVVMGGAADGGLVAYIVADQATVLTRRDLRRALAQQLPDFMIPSQFVRVAALPRNTSGKVDRGRLAGLGARLGDGPKALPQNAEERLVASVWAEVLQTSDFGVDDGFFDVGGTSLMAFDVLERLRGHGCAHIDLIDIFEFPTIRDIAPRLRSDRDLHQLTEVSSRAKSRRARLGAVRKSQS